MDNEPKFYALDAQDAYPEAVGTLDKLELSNGSLWVHLFGKRSKLIGMQSLSFLIGQLEQIREEVFGAPAQLAALREELAKYCNLNDSLMARNLELTAAEQRNAVMAELLVACGLEFSTSEANAWEVMMRDKINAALTKPTESGASE